MDTGICSVLKAQGDSSGSVLKSGLGVMGQSNFAPGLSVEVPVKRQEMRQKSSVGSKPLCDTLE